MFNRLLMSPTLHNSLTSISKILNTVDQIMPIYQKIKPMTNNIKNIFSTIKSFRNESTTTKKVENKKTVNNIQSNLTFFQ